MLSNLLCQTNNTSLRARSVQLSKWEMMWTSRLAALVVLLFAAGTSVSAQDCAAQANCGDCIQVSPDCKWCADEDFEGSSRCYSSSETITCSTEQNPTGGITGQTDDVLDDTNQVSPRTSQITLRPGETVSIPLSVQLAMNYPLDLYLLMDLSASMRDDLDNLKELGGGIAETIAGITENYRLGFGSFVEKRVSPFVRVEPSRLINPCSNRVCASPYSYRHSITLTNDNQFFDDSVQEQVTSSNNDYPEGGFDGFQQSIVCKNMIDWRDNARHLLLYISDAGFHFAGDGRIAGVVEPHPRDQCLMDEDMEPPVNYEQYGKYDYPSVGQIRDHLRRYDIIPIFTVVQSYRSLYLDLVEELSSVGAEFGLLESDSSNIVNLIRDLYNRISQRVVFDPDNVPGLTVNVQTTNCPGTLGADGICSDLAIGEKADFNIEVTATREICSQSSITQNIRIIGFGNAEVQITPICSCECEENTVENSTLCNGNGTFLCGICQCDPGRFGEFCQCDNTGQVTGGTGNDTMCENPNGEECSGQRGKCVCGVCQCNSFFDEETQEMLQYFGTNCECDTSSCLISMGERCGGPQQGTCQCSGCDCNLGFYGDACQCSDMFCVDPDDDEGRTCNGRGECDCNTCRGCESPFTGRHCEICQAPSGVSPEENPCASTLCTPNIACARCALGLIANDSAECVDCPPTVLINVTELMTYRIEGETASMCRFEEEDCTYTFWAAQDGVTGDLLPIHVEMTPECPEPISSGEIAAIIIAPLAVLAIIGIIALLALLFLFWFLNFLEVKRFEKELEKVKFAQNTNPMYMKASKDYENPTYGK